MPVITGDYLSDPMPKHTYTRNHDKGSGCIAGSNGDSMCDSGDYKTGTDDCSIWQRYIVECLKSSDIKCPDFNKFKGTRKGWTKRTPTDWSISCEYDYTPTDLIFKTINDVENWKKQFPNNTENKEDFNVAMANWCSMTVTDCPSGAGDVCSRFSSKNQEESMKCKLWAQNNQDEADVAYTNYCASVNNQNNYDCKCVAAAQVDPLYSVVNAYATESANKCWYRPCATTGVLNTFEDKNKPCPSSVCQNISNFINNSTVDVKDFTQNTTCKINGNSADDKHEGEPCNKTGDVCQSHHTCTNGVCKKDDGNGDGNGVSAWISKNWWILLLVAIISIVLLINFF